MSGIAAHIVASRNLIEAKDGEAEDDENRNTCKLSKLDISDMYWALYFRVGEGNW